jgi:hypothetical protein
VNYLLASAPTTSPDEQTGEQHAYLVMAMTTLCGLELLGGKVLMRHASWDERTSTAPVCGVCLNSAV